MMRSNQTVFQHTFSIGLSRTTKRITPISIIWDSKKGGLSEANKHGRITWNVACSSFLLNLFYDWSPFFLFLTKMHRSRILVQLSRPLEQKSVWQLNRGTLIKLDTSFLVTASIVSTIPIRKEEIFY